jgi:hypothetical protein
MDCDSFFRKNSALLCLMLYFAPLTVYAWVSEQQKQVCAEEIKTAFELQSIGLLRI